MSNPGVVTLATLRNIGKNIERFDIEDNIGEAIHIHLNNIRIDLSIRDFLQVAENVEESLQHISMSDRIEIGQFDPLFLYQMGGLVNQISSVVVEERRLSELTCLVRRNIRKVGTVMFPSKIEHAPAYQYLTGESSRFQYYSQESYSGIDNEGRLDNILESIKTGGYPLDDRRIVLFGEQNFIRDGQHRACVLAFLGGVDQTVPVTVVRFNGKLWKLKPIRNSVAAAARQIASKIRRRLVASRRSYMSTSHIRS